MGGCFSGRGIVHGQEGTGSGGFSSFSLPVAQLPSTASSVTNGNRIHGNTLMVAGEDYGSVWLQRLRKQAVNPDNVTDMIIIGDFGTDLDDEKSLCIAVALQRVGLVGKLAVVANKGNSVLRARLAKGTLNAIDAPECPVAAGSHGGCPDERTHDYEFAFCDYLADESELDARGGHELIFATLNEANEEERKMVFVCNSALTDMAAVMRDSRWEKASKCVTSITVMGGVIRGSGGRLKLDPSASNHCFDLDAAKKVFAYVQSKMRDFSFIIVSRHAAGACQLARHALEGSLHPVAQRMVKAAKPALQACWERVHKTKKERRATKDNLPMRCNVEWYRNSFLVMDTPETLTKDDSVWEWVAGWNEYDGLATIVAVHSALQGVMQCYFDIVKCPKTRIKVIGLNETQHGIKDPEATGELFQELMMMVIGGGNGAWMRRLTELGRACKPVDVLMIGDFGKDLDDEKALCILVAMRRLGIVGNLNVVANLGDSKMRARLAKGTLQVLNASECSVGVGSDGGQPGEELYEHEFAFADYIAQEDSLHPRGGIELVYESLKATKSKDRKCCVVLTSSLTDIAQVLDDKRWAEVEDTVSCVAVMAGVKEEEGGKLSIDPTAANCVFDLPSAEKAYARLQALRTQFLVVSRHAAGACQMPRRAFDGSKHPACLRFVGVSAPALQKLWERTHRTKEERETAKDALPMRCDAQWFRKTFLENDTPDSLGPKDQIWDMVKGFNEYDGLTAVAAIAASHPPLLDEFFAPHRCPETKTLAIGVDAQRHNITDPSRASELLHDCLVLSFERRFQFGMTVEMKTEDDNWQPVILQSRNKKKGADCWRVIDNTKSMPEAHEVFLEAAGEGVSWRLTPNVVDEPVFQDEATTVQYREIAGIKCCAMMTEVAWRTMREGFLPQPEDVFVVGTFGSGRGIVQAAVLGLKHGGEIGQIDMSLPYTFEMAMSRGRLDLITLDRMAPQNRVFKSFMPRQGMWCKLGDDQQLPVNGQIIYVVRDPRDIAVSQWKLPVPAMSADSTKLQWGSYIDAWCNRTDYPLMGDWVETTIDWWETANRYPGRVHWVIFEEIVREPQRVVAGIADFLKVPVEPNMVETIADAIAFDKMKERWGKDFGPALRTGRIGSYTDFFTPWQMQKFRQKVINPVLDAGIPLAADCREDDESIQAI